MEVSGDSIIIGLTAVANIGAVGYIAKSIVGKVEQHSELLPKIVASLDSNAKTQQVISASIAELFDSRNDHAERLTTIETTHALHGCNSGGRRDYDPSERPRCSDDSEKGGKE